MSDSVPLLAIPLQGRHLLEASAGTGKTWTISGLFVRLLLESGLGVEQILVVTYTNAASAELCDRIRRRLREVHDMLEQQRSGGDPLLDAVHAACASAEQRALALHRLRQALAGFDAAAIYTIHGFCQRVLNEYPFECGLRGDEELGPGQELLRQMALDDYWRRFCSHADSRVQLLLQFAGVEQLDPDLLRMLSSSEDRLLPEGPGLPALADELDDRMQSLVALWNSGRDELAALYGHENLQPAEKKKAADKVAALGQWLDEGGELPPKLRECGAEFLARKCSKAGGTVRTLPPHPFFEAIDQLCVLKERLPALVRRDTLSWSRSRLECLKQGAGVLDYDDLLGRVQGALHGAGGQALGACLRARFPAALIDEFQDTDPVQYRIFNRIYPTTGPTQALLAFVGDPKQAIYGFRGGDIFAYIKARDSVQRRLSLSANFRSSTAMLRAVNALFDPQANPQPFFYPGIQYEAVTAGRSGMDALSDPDGNAAMRVWRVGGGNDVPAKPEVADACAAATAAEIARLLREARIGERAVEPHDICVLVLRHDQGARVQQAMQALHIPCVRSGQDNVFHSDQARELAIVLQAVVQPARSDWQRAALGTRLCGRDAVDIGQLSEETEARVGEQFSALQRCWLRDGFLAMFDAWLDRFDVVTRLLGEPDGERAVTNLQHLAELAHAAAVADEMAPEQLLDWFTREILDPDEGDAETRQLRLESDADRVRIMTVHKSKGLEFNICFAPFLLLRGAPQAGSGRNYHLGPPAHERVLDFLPDEQARRLHGEEHLAEGLRLVYVAVTRAVHRCYIAWGQCNEAWKSPLAWLFHGGAHVADADPLQACSKSVQADVGAGGQNLQAALAGWLERAGDAVDVADLPQPDPAMAPSRAADDRVLGQREFSGSLRRGWVLSSYSGIVARRDPERPDYDEHAAMAVDADLEQPETPFLALPGGTAFGTAIHRVFELLRPEDAGQDRRAVIRAALGASLGLDAAELARWTSATEGMLEQVLATPLDAAGLSLAELSRGSYINEMGFGCALDGFSGRELGQLLGAHPRYREAGFDQAARSLPAIQLQTFLNGEIDLCFEAGGRYFIADWKTNLLGRRRSAYHPDALAECVRSHHYYLQYLLYTLALHRHLRVRLQDYDYEQHFGGVYYLFVRGMDGSGNGVYFDRPPQLLVDALDVGVVNA